MRLPAVRFRLAVVVIVAALLSPGAGAGETVHVENASRATRCAENDNVYVKFTGAGVRRLTIEALHPAYLTTLRDDRTAANFTDCDMSHDPSYPFQPKDVILYDGPDYRLVGHTFSGFWRPGSVDFQVGNTVTRELHLVQLIRKIGGRQIEILVVYPSDGYWRAKPLPPAGLTDTAYGSSFLVGPIEEAGRPFVAFRSIEFVPADLSFRLAFKEGEGRLRVAEASPRRTRLEISLPPLQANAVFAALRSMFVSPSMADTAEAIVTRRNGPPIRGPIMDFTAAEAGAVTFGRSIPSDHNTSAPDMRFAGFAR